MTYSNNYSVHHSLKKLFMQRYERYLPTAFDESMSLLQKMNKLIEAQNQMVDVVNTHMEWTNETLERAFDIIDTNLKDQLGEFKSELDEQTRLYEEIRDKLHSDLLPDTVKQKLEEWLLNGTIKDLIEEEIFQEYFDRLSEMEDIVRNVDREIVIRVPGDMATLQEAIDYSKTLFNGVKVDILIQKGHRPSKGFTARDVDLRHVIIKSEDAEVLVANNFTGTFMEMINGTMPTLATVIDMNNKGADGYRLEAGGSGHVRSQCGIKRAGGTGVYVANSTLRAIFSVFSHHNDRNVWVTRASSVSMDGADLSHCQGGGVGIYVSRSSIFEASNSDMSNCQNDYSTLASLRSRVTILNADLSNAKRDAISCNNGGVVSGSNCNLSNAGRHAVEVANGSSCNLLSNSDISNSGSHALYARERSTISAININTTDIGGDVARAENASVITINELYVNRCQGSIANASNSSTINIPTAKGYNTQEYGVFASDNSSINARHSIIKSVRRNVAYAVNGSNINVRNAELTGGVNGIEARNSSTINAQDVDTFNNSNYGSYAETLSTINLRNGRSLGLGYDVLCSNGSSILAYGIRTTNAQPNTTDMSPNVSNNVTSNGVIYYKSGV